MRLKTTRVDIVKTKSHWPESPFQPALVEPRKADNLKWLVADSPIIDNTALSWADASNDEYVRIPLFQYDLSPAGDLALATMFHLGVLCSNANFDTTIAHLHIVTGDPVELVEDNTGTIVGMRYWFGFAVALKE
jgi:hypothetical protein